MNKKALTIENNDKTYIANTYKRFDICIEKGEGAKLYDYDGKEYIDFSSGIGTLSFGVKDNEWINAVTNQINLIQHTSNLYYNEPQTKLAKLLCEKTGMKKVFFSNSGAESNECAIKTARKYSFDKYGEGRYEIICLENSFHGRTIATLSATGQDVFHQYFMPFVDGFKFAKANDNKSVDDLISNKTCAIMLETIQGEAGVNDLNEDFIKHIDELCKKHDLVFIVDEVQTGNGRTGYFYSYMQYGVTPDVVTTAKGIAGGLPMGAILFSDKVEHTLGYGEHGSTFGGNPVCAAAAYSIISRIDDNLLAHVKEMGAIIRERLTGVKHVKKITGKGLIVGIQFDDAVTNLDICKKAMDNGVICLTAKKNLRLLPPLSITKEELNLGLDRLIKTIEEA
jgi:acetylornithine/N-succinyldiaminopimelate aminotransferase